MALRLILAILALLPTPLLASAQQLPPELVVQGGGNNPGRWLEFGGGGRWLAEGTLSQVRIFDAESRRVTRVLAPADSVEGRTYGVAFAAHPTVDIVVMPTSRGQLVAFDVTSGAERWRVNVKTPGRAESYRTAIVRIDGERDLLSAYFPEALVGWAFFKASTGEPLLAAASPKALSFSSDGRWYFALEPGTDQEFRLHDSQSQAPITGVLPGFPMAFHPSSRRVVVDISRSIDPLKRPMPPRKPLALIDVDSGVPLGSWDAWMATFSADGSKLLLWTPLARNVGLPWWNVVDAQSGVVIAEGPPTTLTSGSVAIHGDGSRLAFVDRDSLTVISVGESTAPPAGQSSALVAPAAGRDLGAAAAGTATATPEAEAAGAFTEDRRWFVMRAADGKIDVWDAATGNRMPFRLPAPPKPRGALRVQPATQGTPERAEWQPVVVTSDNDWTERMGVPRQCQSILRSMRLAGQEVDLNLRCSGTADGRRLVTWEPQPEVRRGFFADYAATLLSRRGTRPRRLVVLDGVSQKILAVLRGTSKESGATPEPNDLSWSPDAQFLVGSTSKGELRRARLRIWRAETGAEMDLGTMARTDTLFWGFVPGTTWIVTSRGPSQTGSPDRIRVTDISTLRTLVELPVGAIGGWIRAAAGEPMFDLVQAGVNAATNGRVWVGPDDDGSLWIRRTGSGDLLGNVRALPSGEWLVTTPSGLFDGSPGGWRQIAWRSADGTRVESGEQYFNEFYQPGLLAELLGAREPRAVRSFRDLDRRQPIVTLTSSPVDLRMARVRLTVKENRDVAPGSGARDLRLFRNGVLVKTWRGALALDANGEAQYETDVAVVAGANRLVAYAFNSDNIKSVDATAIVDGAGPARAGTIYVLAIGINQYANQEFHLRFAVPDAVGVATEFERQQRALGASNVQVVTLLDGDATRANIMAAIGRLAGSNDPLAARSPPALAALQPAQPEDIVVVYFAGHGMAAEDRFHLIPADMVYAGPRKDVARALPDLLSHSISDLDLERVLEPVNAKRLILIIDACNSGQALEADDHRFGPMNSRGLAQLAYEKGMSILTASQAYQAALETAQLGHGYLTFALVEEGLKTPAADRLPADGEVTSLEWFEYAASRVPQLQVDAMTKAQHEGRELRFDLDASVRSGGLQTPRVFSRRDDSEIPFVVAKP